jgi:hypothetical protein
LATNWIEISLLYVNKYQALKMEAECSSENVSICPQVHMALLPRRPTLTSPPPQEPQISLINIFSGQKKKRCIMF